MCWTMPAVEPDEVRGLEDVGRALGVREDGDVRVLPAERPDLVAGEALVHLAVTLPEDELGLRLRGHVASPGTRRAGRSPAATFSDSTTSTALAEVQQTSDSAFTSAEVLT